MNFKLASSLKDFFDVIRAISAYFSIAAIGILVILYTVSKDAFETFFRDHAYISYTIGSLLILLPIITPFAYRWVQLIVLKRRKLSNIIIERQDVVVDITHNGKNASYYERMCFYKIGKHHTPYMAKLIVSGSIDSNSITASNCYYRLNNDKTKLAIFYTNTSQQLNKYRSLVNGNEKFLMYSATIKDSFIAEEEFWDLLPKNYCMFYNITFLFPIGKKIKYAKLYKRDPAKNDEENLVELDGIAPVIVTENDRTKMILQIVDYDYGDYLRLKWKLD